MTVNGWLQILLFLAVVLALTKPLGLFMTRVFGGERTFLHPLLRTVERVVYRLTGVDEAREMRWTDYCLLNYDRKRLASNPSLPRGRAPADEAARALYDARLRRRADVPASLAQARRARRLQVDGRGRGARDALD